MAELDINYSRNPSPEQIAALGIASAFRPLEILGQGSVQRANRSQDEAYRAAEQAAQQAFRLSLEDQRSKRDDALWEKHHKLAKEEADAEKLRALRVQAAGLGIDTKGLKTEEDLAGAIGNATRSLSEANLRGNIRANREAKLAALGLPPDATLEDEMAAEAKARAIGQAVGQQESGRLADQWLKSPEAKPVVDRYTALSQTQERLLAQSVDELFKLPPIDKRRVGEALAVSPELTGIKLTPDQLAIIKSGNWELLASNPKARMKREDATLVLEAAAAEMEKQHNAGMLIAKEASTAFSRTLSAKLDNVRREMDSLTKAHPQLMYAVQPAGQPADGGAEAGPGADLPPLPPGPSAVPTGAAAPRTAPAPAANPIAAEPAPQVPAYGPPHPRDQLIQKIAQAQSMIPPISFGSPEFYRSGGNTMVRSPEPNPFRAALYDATASALGVQPQPIGSSTLMRDPRSVVAGGLEQYSPQFDALSEEEKNRAFIQALISGAR